MIIFREFEFQLEHRVLQFVDRYTIPFKSNDANKLVSSLTASFLSSTTVTSRVAETSTQSQAYDLGSKLKRRASIQEDSNQESPLPSGCYSSDPLYNVRPTQEKYML